MTTALACLTTGRYDTQLEGWQSGAIAVYAAHAHFRPGRKAIGASRSCPQSRWPIGPENASIRAKPIGASPRARGRPSAGPIFHRTTALFPSGAYGPPA